MVINCYNLNGMLFSVYKSKTQQLSSEGLKNCGAACSSKSLERKPEAARFLGHVLSSSSYSTASEAVSAAAFDGRKISVEVEAHKSLCCSFLSS